MTPTRNQLVGRYIAICHVAAYIGLAASVIGLVGPAVQVVLRKATSFGRVPTHGVCRQPSRLLGHSLAEAACQASTARKIRRVVHKVIISVASALGR